MIPGDSKAGRAGADRWLFWGLVALLVWAPWPLGSNRPWSAALLGLWAAALGGLWLVQAMRWRAVPSEALGRAWGVLAILLLWLAFGVLQVIPLPMDWLLVLSPRAADHWLQTRALLDPAGHTGPAPLSLDPSASLGAMRLGLTLVGVWVLTLLLVRSRRRLRLLAWVLVTAAVAQATLAGLAVLTGEGLWPLGPSPQAQGTFANRNHLAGYLEMSLALGLGLLVSELSEPDPSRTLRQRLRDWTRTLLGPKARLRIFLAIMTVALVMTASRMGNIAFFASLLAAAVLGMLGWRRAPRPVLILLASLVLIDLSILGGWFGLDRVRERIERTEPREEPRYLVNLSSADYLRDYPWLGSGGGSFSVVFPAYRDPGLIPQHFAHADNDILELQLEYGALGLGLLGAAVLLSLGAGLKVLLTRRDPLLRGMALASLMGSTAILIHSGADSNLHIPANAALFMVLLALPWLGLSLGRDPQDAQAADSPGRGSRRRQASPMTTK